MSSNKVANSFVSNVLVYGLSGVLNKVVPFIMIPIIAKLLEDPFFYGIQANFNVFVSFVGALAILGIYDGLIRIIYEQASDQERIKVYSSCLNVLLIISLIICILGCFLRDYLSLFLFDSLESNYQNLIYLALVSVCLSMIQRVLIAPTRVQNKKKVFIIFNFITPVCGYLGVYLLIFFGYKFWALPSYMFFQSFFAVIVFYLLNFKWFSFRVLDIEMLKHVVKFGLPLSVVFLIYWVYNSFDRLMISEYLGINELGVYSVAQSMAAISGIIYFAFSQGWKFFVYEVETKQGNTTVLAKISEYLILVTGVSVIIVIPFRYMLFEMFFESQFIGGAKYFPYLFLNPLLLMIYQSIGAKFLVNKKTYLSAIALACGAIINVGLNLLLIPLLEVEGACIATSMGYLVAIIIAYTLLYKSGDIILSGKTLIVVILLIILFIINRMDICLSKSIFLSLIMIIGLLLLYKEDVFILLKKLFNGLSRK